MADLHIIAGPRAGETVALDKNKITFGRHSTCDFVLKDRTVSRLHFYVERTGDKFFLIDQESNNGTFVNDEQVSWVELKDKDKIEVGISVMIAELPERQKQPVAENPSAKREPSSAGGGVPRSPFDAEHKRTYPGEYLEGIELFNAGRYFDAHEIWEEIWLRSSGATKLFYQMLIQAAVGLHHYERGNARGGRGMHKAVAGKIGQLPKIFMSLDVADFSHQYNLFFADLIERDNEAAPPTDRPRPFIRLLGGNERQ